MEVGTTPFSLLKPDDGHRPTNRLIVRLLDQLVTAYPELSFMQLLSRLGVKVDAEQTKQSSSKTLLSMQMAVKQEFITQKTEVLVE